MNIGASESEGVDAHDASLDGNWSIDHLNTAVGEGGNVRVGITEVKVWCPNSSFQRKQDLQGNSEMQHSIDNT